MKTNNLRANKPNIHVRQFPTYSFDGYQGMYNTVSDICRQQSFLSPKLTYASFYRLPNFHVIFANSNKRKEGSLFTPLRFKVAKDRLTYKNFVFIFVVGPPQEYFFLTSIYVLYFSHHYTRNNKHVHVIHTLMKGRGNTHNTSL